MSRSHLSLVARLPVTHLSIWSDIFCCRAAQEMPAAYTAVTMERHMETTMTNLQQGKGAWDSAKGVSRTATYVYD